MNWEIGIDMYTLICVKWMTNKNLLYKKINKIQKFKKKRKEPKKEPIFRNQIEEEEDPTKMTEGCPRKQEENQEKEVSQKLRKEITSATEDSACPN